MIHLVFCSNTFPAFLSEDKKVPTVPLSTTQGPPPTLQVDAASEPSGYIPLHLACLTGHVGVVGLLLSRSTELLKVETTSKDIGLLAKSGSNIE